MAPASRAQSSPELAVDTARRGKRRAVERVSFGAALGAVFVGLVLGLAVLAWVHRSRDAHRATAPRKARTAVPSATPAAPSGEPAVASVQMPSTHVLLRVPSGARLFVQGKELALGEHRVPRPARGSTRVLVKAEARHERWIEVTEASPEEIEVTLAVKAKPKTTDPHAQPTSTLSMPPNPYE